jgi:hypothetical protein
MQPTGRWGAEFRVGGRLLERDRERKFVRARAWQPAADLYPLGLIRTGSRLIKSGRRSAFLLGLALGALIWLLSPVITGQREPWDAEGGYYPGALVLTGLLGGLAMPPHWGSVAIGIFAGQAVVLLGGVVAEPASGGLWPLGLLFLAGYSVLGLVGAGIGTALIQHRGRRGRSRGG